jgi:ABC-type proline/glycine betaine transport system substrate-binding protein
MGKMSWISYLCENEMKEELIKELNMPDLVSLTGKSPEEIADGFIEAHKEIKKRKKEPAYKVLNKIHNNMKEYNDGKMSSVRVQSKK